MGGTIEPRGVDLARIGIRAEELPEGEPVGCRVGDAPVVAVRRGEQVYVLDAACPHYGADLAEGAVVGDTLRCPWHHACFALRDGATNHAPALRDLGCWMVERRGDRWFAAAPAEPAQPARRSGGPASVVVVGAGAAGAAAVATLRSEGFAGKITLIGREAPVDRPNLSKDYLAGAAPEAWIPLRDEACYAEQAIDARFGREVTAIDPQRRTVTLDGGEKLGWEALILAPGAQPIRLPIPGADLAHVHVLRTLEDSRRIRQAAANAQRVVVLGASFIGLECAAALRKLGLEIDVVAPELLPLGKVLGPQVGAFLQRFHESRGVRFHLGRAAAAIDEHVVTLSDESLLPADLVIAGVGVRPDVALAEAAGLSINNGILVNRQLQAAPGIWAAGDAARFPDRSGSLARIEHWVVAMAQGRCAARNALGAAEPFDAVPFFWSAHDDLTLAYVGHAEEWDTIDAVGDLDAGPAAFAYRRAGRTLAVLTLNRDDLNLAAEQALQASDEVALHRLIPPL